MAGATSYKIYRTASAGTPATTGLLGTTTSTIFNDTGLAGSGTVSTANTTGNMTLSGSLGINNLNPQNKLAINTPTTNDTTAQLLVSTAGTTNKGIVIQAVSGQTTNGNLLEFQDCQGNVFAKFDHNANLTVANATITTTLTINGHIVTGGSTPGIAAGSAACTSPTVSIQGTDTAGMITVTTGTGCTAPGDLATVTFASGFGAVPRVILTPAMSLRVWVAYGM